MSEERPSIEHNDVVVFTAPQGDGATDPAELISQLGLAGMTMGQARVSRIHPDRIVAGPDATQEEIAMLVSYVKQQVRDQCGIQLLHTDTASKHH